MLPSPILASKSSNVKCFKYLGIWHIASQCHNKRSMIMRFDNGEMFNKCADGGSSVNVASSRLVEKLKLPTLHVLVQRHHLLVWKLFGRLGWSRSSLAALVSALVTDVLSIFIQSRPVSASSFLAKAFAICFVVPATWTSECLEHFAFSFLQTLSNESILLEL
ncbi:hypothetical protein CR513_26469, partial [Mucuna pruriens]